MPQRMVRVELVSGSSDSVSYSLGAPVGVGLEVAPLRREHEAGFLRQILEIVRDLVGRRSRRQIGGAPLGPGHHQERLQRHVGRPASWARSSTGSRCPRAPPSGCRRRRPEPPRAASAPERLELVADQVGRATEQLLAIRARRASDCAGPAPSGRPTDPAPSRWIATSIRPLARNRNSLVAAPAAPL